MSKKATIVNLLKTMNNEWKAADAEIEQIYAQNGYTPVFKEEKAEEVRERLNNTLEQIKAKIMLVIDDKLESLFKPGANTFDAAYQSRLTNVLNIVTLTGSDLDLRDLKAMIEPFNKDYTALQAIRAAITNTGIDKNKDYPVVLSSLATGALEDRKETHRKLVKFKNSLNGFSITRSMGSIEWVQGSEYLGYDPFLNTLDDDLNYIKELDNNKTYTEPIGIELEIK